MASAVPDGPGEVMVATLLEESHLVSPHALVPHIARRAAAVGNIDVTDVYVIDLQQVRLTPLPGGSAAGPLAVDTTVAGLAYRTVSARTVEAPGGRLRVYMPVVDGVARVGVLEALVDRFDELTARRLRMLANLVALLVLSKGEYSDTYARLRRTEPMSLAAEMEWAFMPPLSFATPQVVLNAVLEPVYQLGGDAFDYSLIDDVLHLAVFDAMGHDVRAGTAASIAMGTCRNTRRAGAALPDLAVAIDHAIDDQFDRVQFVTGILTHLHLDTGRLRWVNCGQPPPLLIRDGHVVRVLRGRPRAPLGLGPLLGAGRPEVHEERLQPGDRVICYTDGVLDALAPDGQAVGPARLAQLVRRDTARDLPPAEALRRLSRAMTARRPGKLTDDATIVMVDWNPEDTGRLYP